VDVFNFESSVSSLSQVRDDSFISLIDKPGRFSVKTLALTYEAESDDVEAIKNCLSPSRSLIPHSH
jgi:hypothetical protein